MGVDVDAAHGGVMKRGVPSGAQPDKERNDDGEPGLNSADLNEITDFDAELEDKSETSAVSGRGRRPVRLALTVGVAASVVGMALAGWFGFDAYHARQADQQRDLFLQVARQGALNLTTISYTQIYDDVERILESATGEFYDDFDQRAAPFIEVMKQSQAATEGTITEAAVESEEHDHAQVLVAVSVKTSNGGVVEDAPRLWRMRIGVQKVDDGTKVAEVRFVP